MSLPEGRSLNSSKCLSMYWKQFCIAPINDVQEYAPLSSYDLVYEYEWNTGV